MTKPAATYALCEVVPTKVRHPNRQKRQRFPVPAWRFREARLQCGLGVEACADLLRVSDRTIRNWESGTVRIPYAAYKLMRVLKGGKFLGPEWHGYNVYRGVLVTPEGHRFEAGELAWWSLLVRRARAFSDLLHVRDHEPTPERKSAPQGPIPLGLSLYTTSDKCGVRSVSQGRDTLTSGAESAAVGPGGVIPVPAPCRPLAPLPLVAGGVP